MLKFVIRKPIHLLCLVAGMLNRHRGKQRDQRLKTVDTPTTITKLKKKKHFLDVIYYLY